MNSLDLTLALGVAIGGGLLISLVLTPLVRLLFLKIGIADRPDANRKLQRDAVSLGGGLAVFLATCAASVAAIVFAMSQGWTWSDDRGTAGHAQELLIAAVATLALGLVDDSITLRGRQKLLGQIAISAYIVTTGTVVRQIELFGYQIDLGVMAGPLTAVWILAAINAVNLIDGADGIASTAGSIILASLAIMAIMSGWLFEGIVASAMAAALVGFLRYNWPPARIYLGDAGSMLIGLVIGLFAVWSNHKQSATIAFVVPLAALAVPLFDSSIAIIRRVLTGRSIYSADRGHLHHQLATRFSPRTMLFIVAAMCTLTGGGAVLGHIYRQQWIAIAGAALVIGGLVGSGWFGKAEMWLLIRRLANFANSLLTRAQYADNAVRQQTHQLQGCRRWDEIWTTLTEFANRHQLCRLRLDLNLSWQHEGYHGEWRTVRQPDRVERWSMHLPVLSAGRMVGKLEVAGRAVGSSSFQSMESLASLLQDLQPLVDRLFAELDAKTNPAAADKSLPAATTDTVNDAEPVATIFADPVIAAH